MEGWGSGGREEETFYRKFLPPFPRTPIPPSSKIFDFIESLFRVFASFEDLGVVKQTEGFARANGRCFLGHVIGNGWCFIFGSVIVHGLLFRQCAENICFFSRFSAGGLCDWGILLIISLEFQGNKASTVFYDTALFLWLCLSLRLLIFSMKIMNR